MRGRNTLAAASTSWKKRPHEDDDPAATASEEESGDDEEVAWSSASDAESGGDDERERELERALADVPFGELQRSSSAAVQKVRRASKKRPMEVSAMVRPPRIREVIQVPKKIPVGKETDRLSELPNDVLLNILDRLDTPDAVRTCILSKKMVSLRCMLSRFIVDVRSFAPKDASYYTPSDVIRMNGAVADAADSVLNFRNKQITLSHLSMRFFLKYDHCLSICKSVANAMATHKIDRAELAIRTEKRRSFCTDDDVLLFAKQFNTFISTYPDAFAGLTYLELQCLRFGESDIPNILTTCKRLESLFFCDCDSGRQTVLEIQHPQLVELGIYNGDFEIVKLNCLPKLKRMVYWAWNCDQDPLSFGYVPLLSSLKLSNSAVGWQKTIRLSEFFANVTTITDLHLNFRSEKIWVHPECPKLLAPVFHNLEIVNLDLLPEGCDIAWTMFILEAAPNLKELSITVWDHWCRMVIDKEERIAQGYVEGKTNVEWESSASGFKHANFSKLTIYGFQPDGYFVGYIRQIVQAAVNLVEISLYDRNVCLRCDDLDPEIKVRVSPSRYPKTSEEKNLLMKEITEGLEVALPDIIHFSS